MKSVLYKEKLAKDMIASLLKKLAVNKSKAAYFLDLIPFILRLKKPISLYAYAAYSKKVYLTF